MINVEETNKNFTCTQTNMGSVYTNWAASSGQSIFIPIMDLSLVTMNPSPTDSSFSIYTQQQSKPFILHGIMDVVVCWIGLIGLKYKSQFHEPQRQTGCWPLCCAITERKSEFLIVYIVRDLWLIIWPLKIGDNNGNVILSEIIKNVWIDSQFHTITKTEKVCKWYVAQYAMGHWSIGHYAIVL